MLPPESLWNSNILHLPRDLNSIYKFTLEKLNLLGEALGFTGNQGGHGGATEEDTNKHYACLYPNSAARVQCVLIDPNKTFGAIPHDLRMTLSSHRISLLDMPCGAGAGAISLLSTIKELRIAGTLPYTPLSVDIHGADISEHALSLYRTQVDLLIPKLAEVGIRVTLTCHQWDASSLPQTTDLLDAYFAASDVSEYFILVANFSGEGKSKFTRYQDSFEQLWVRLSGKKAKQSTILWVEPHGNSGRDVFQKLSHWGRGKFPWLRSLIPDGKNYIMCEYNFFHFIQDKPVESGVAIHGYTRDGRKQR